MKVKCFSVHNFEKKYLERWTEKFGLDVAYTELALTPETAPLCKGFECASCWASDDLSADVLEILKENGIKMISLRSAGYSHLNLGKAKELGLKVARVPAYSPEAIAEHTLGLLMCLNRKYHLAFQRTRNFNFTLEGLEGVTLHGKKAGVIGVGKIGEAFARIMRGMGCSVLLNDPYPNEELARELGAEYVDLDTLLKESDIISLHCPLTEDTRHLINERAFDLIQPKAFLLNTGRGALIETKALIDKLKRRELKGVGLDVYEYEEGVFFKDHSEHGISDETLLRLMTFPNVLITSHQAFFTKEALENIAGISMENIDSFFKGKKIAPENILV